MDIRRVRVETADREVLEWRWGGGLLWAFGVLGWIPCLAMAPSLYPEPHWRIVPFVAGFGLVGSALALGRMTLTVDARRGRVTRSWGLLGLRLCSRVRLVEEFGRLEIRRTTWDGTTGYEVRLRGAGAPLLLLSSEDRDASYAMAESVARLLGVPLEDEPVQDAVRDRAAHSGRSVSEQQPPAGESPTLESRPSALRSAVRESSGRLEIEVPALGIRRAHLGILALSGVGPALSYLVLLPTVGAVCEGAVLEVARMLVVLSFVAAPVLVSATLIALDACRGWGVVLEEGTIRLEERGLLGARRHEVPARLVRSLAVVPSPRASEGPVIFARRDAGLWIRSHLGACSFGSHLAAPELESLRALLEARIESPAVPGRARPDAAPRSVRA